MDSFITKRFNFAAGEVQVVTTTDGQEYVDLEANLRSSDDIMALFLVTDAIRRRGVKEINLLMPYVPYSRQDRVMNEGEALGIRVFCDLINSQKYNKVSIWDPHSEVTSALLNNVEVVEQHTLVTMSLNPQGDTLVCPDAGARKKISKLAQKTGCDVVFADKSRNTKTGEITGTIISEEPVVWLKERPHLIVDDICDGGRTFIELARTLKLQGVTGAIGLYVTHAILPRGVADMNGLIDDIYTYNCWPSEDEIKASNSANKTQIVLL